MFTDEEKKLLSTYVTSSDADVFAVKNMSGMVGAAYARYSRAKGGFREVLLKEFIKEGIIDPRHADQLIQRILIAYGDDSVGELEGAHLSFEQITMLAAKEIEDRRIGGSPIEQSTRYVLYDQKDDQNQWRYYQGKEVVETEFGEQYQQTMDTIFQTYADMVEPMRRHLQQLKPIEEAEYDIVGNNTKQRLADLTDEQHIKAFKRTYTFELRAKACDILRNLLPIATLTNVGMFGNGRFYQGLITYLLTSDIPENQAIAEKARTALNEIIPQYIRRAQRLEYNAATRNDMAALSQELFGTIAPAKPDNVPDYVLLDRGETHIEKRIRQGIELKQIMNEVSDIAMLGAMVYPYTNLPLTQLRQIISGLDDSIRKRIIATYTGNRKTRRDRPGRALEDGYPYTFDLVTNFGVYKDLQRHRMNTQQRQLFTTKIGFHLPEEIETIGATDKAMQCVRLAEELYDRMHEESPLLAQYAVLHGHYIRWTIGMNDREAMHMLELRSTPQGHPQYREAAQAMHRLIKKQSAWRGDMMSFVDYEPYYWSRADSEAKQRVKEARLDKKLAENQ